MQRFYSLIFSFVFSLCCLHAQDDGLQSILSQLPAKNTRVLERVMVQLTSHGADAVHVLSQKLNTQGNQDEKARYALSGLAKYLGNQPEDDRRAKIEDAFIKAINQQPALELKVFLLEQFQFFATDQSLPEVRNLVRALCDPAIVVIQQIGGQKALQTLIDSYDEAGDYCKQALAKAMAEFDHPEAVVMLEKIAKSAEVVPKDHIMPLLANKGASSSLPLLTAFAESNPQTGQRLLFEHAVVQAKKGDPSTMITHTTNMIKARQDGPMMQRALEMLAKHGGSSGKKILQKAYKKGSPEITPMIIAALGNPSALPLATLFKRIDKISPIAQVGLLKQAVREEYKPALPFAQNLVQSTDPEVVRAAISAISALGRAESLAHLGEITSSTTNPVALEASTKEIARWIDSSNLDIVNALLDRTGGLAKAKLIEMVADRGLTATWSKIREALNSTDPLVRKSAFTALPMVAGDQSIAQLVTIAPEVRTEEERESLVNTLTKSVGKSTDKDQSVGELIRLIGGDPQIIQTVLPKIGGEKALEFVVDKYAAQPDTYHKILLNWEKPEVLGMLIARGRDSSPTMTELTTIFRLLQHPELPGDQRLLYLRELMPLVSDLTDRSKVLELVGGVRTQPAFDYVAQYLNDDDLKQTAAEVLVGLALPPAGERVGLFGSKVRRDLMRADTILTGTDHDYTRAFLHNYLSTMPAGEGYVKIFNGVDLAGWKGLVGNPISRDTMFGLERQTQEREVARTLAERWKVENGILTYVGDGFDNLCTTKKYRDFELILDWRIEKDADSGIYLRGSPQVQIWDVHGSDEKNKVGSGGLFNNEIHASDPLVVADNPTGEWNTFRIIMIDDKVTVYLNGILVTDQEVLENYWNRALPIFREEQIELQAHTTVVQFRDIYVRELLGGPELSSIELRQGFKPLFNGINLDGWVGNKTDYVAENGEIVIYPGAGGRGNLFTEKEYENFRLRFEFKLTPGANNGLGIHAPLEGDAAYVGKELQILDNTADKYANLKEYQYHGSVYGVVAARRGELKPVGEWNEQEVVVKDNRISVVLNNQRILSADLNIVARDGTLDGKEHPGLKRTKGHIGFLGHGDEVHFRNIRILEIKEETE